MKDQGSLSSAEQFVLGLNRNKNIKDEFNEKVLALLPRKDQYLTLNLNAGDFGPAFLESAHSSYVYLETLGYQIPIMERMLFSGSSKPTLEWDADLFTKLSSIPFDQFPFDLFDRLCPYKEAIPQLKNIHHLIKSKKVLIIGSEDPWLELFCSICGASVITTVEYRPITWKGTLSTKSVVESITWSFFEENIEKFYNQFDLILTYSSIEHSGLGRYGDPLTPLGDLYTFLLISKCMTQNGLCGVAVPVGQDLTHFNAHRIYGEKRIRALAFVGDMNYIGLVAPSKEYYEKNEEIDFLKSGWTIENLAQLPLGKLRQPLLLFARDGFDIKSYIST